VPSSRTELTRVPVPPPVKCGVPLPAPQLRRPRRELAFQLADQFRALGAGMALTVRARCALRRPAGG